MADEGGAAEEVVPDGSRTPEGEGTTEISVPDKCRVPSGREAAEELVPDICRTPEGIGESAAGVDFFGSDFLPRGEVLEAAL